MFIRPNSPCTALAGRSSLALTVRSKSRPTPGARSLSLLIARLALLAVASISLFVAVPSALAAGPATVTVEVEGLSETKLPPTQVTTTTNPVVKNNTEGNPEGSCSGTSAAGALQLATAGNWSGPWSAKYSQYEIFTIEGETHQFEESSKANYYWSFWLNDQEATTGACEAELGAGDRVLFFPACYGEACPPSPTPLGIEAPTIANAGESVAVTVKQYNAKGEASPAPGATVSGGGTSATTDSHGHAAMRFSGDGTYTLEATGSPEAPTPGVRTETSICVHEGNDGTCGTKAPAGTTSVVQSSSTSLPGRSYTGPFALVARATGLSEGHVYAHGHAPRTLTGNVLAHAVVDSVNIGLRRSYRGRCYTYKATSERFVRTRCGTDSLFKVASGGTAFSYLLPAQLPPGRYVFDIGALDAAGNHVALARGSSRIVFYVR
jgi:hypothetical protein